MSNLILLNGRSAPHQSASQRQIAALIAAADHFKAVIAILVAQSGGFAIVPRDSLNRQYDLFVKEDPLTHDITYRAAPHVEPDAEEKPLIIEESKA